MADGDRSADDVAKEWPVEGHFVVGPSGLYVSTACLGRTFTSRTASQDFTIGLPRVEGRPDPIPPEIRRRLGEPPAMPRWDLLPPAWTYGPRDDTERFNEETISPVWGAILDDGRAKTVYPESARDLAVVYRCRFYTTFSASDGNEAAEGFLGELDDWWSRFTSWVGILTGQDFVGLGGSSVGIVRAYQLITWTSDESGQRANMYERRPFGANQRTPISKLQLSDLEACVTATGKQVAPPEDWLFIRDARSMLKAGQARRAVLDAGTAAELAMTTLVDQYLDDANADEATGKAFARGWNTLGAKKELLGILRPGLLSGVPSVQADLIDLRNTASHGRSKAGRRWDEITFEQAQTAVEIASTIVELAHPVASLLATQTA